MVLNEKESAVLNQIKENPYISQQELAEGVELSRSSIANIISGLVNKGYLMGRAYVVNDDRPVVCIGAFNIDRFYELQDEPIAGMSNDVKTTTGAGGVARNVAENLGRLNVPATLLSVVGDETSWNSIRKLSQPYINLGKIEELPSFSTASYTEVYKTNGDMVVAMADMEIYAQMTPAWLSKHQKYLEKAKMIVVDTSIPKDSIEQLISFSERSGIPLILVCASIPTLKHIPSSLEGLHTLIVKHDETAQYFNKKMDTQLDLIEGVKEWRKKGVQSVFMIKDSSTIVYSGQLTGSERIFVDPDKERSRYKWGISEAMCGGWVYGLYTDKDREESGWYALANSFTTSFSSKEYVVRPDLSQKKLEIDKKWYKENWDKIEQVKLD